MASQPPSLAFNDVYMAGKPQNTPVPLTIFKTYSVNDGIKGQAKSRFSHDDLIERGQALIEESISFGVTHMRAFVEVDLDVGMKCLDAGLELKERFKERCYVQICVFAQNAIVSYEDAGKEMKALLEKAVGREGVEVLGSTPYVEKGGERKAQVENIRFTVEMALKYTLHVDFHIDYNLDARNHSMVFEALELLDSMNWPSKECSPDFRTIVFGHCTRLTLFDNKEWDRLRDNIGNLPVSFVGLPTSDLFMMGRPDSDLGGGVRPRGTLQIPQMIKKYGLNGAIGINNVGNAFTPQGNCDPLSLASLGVAVYQAGTKEDADILLQCVSSRARHAIGLKPLSTKQSKSNDSESFSVEADDLCLSIGDRADFVVFGNESTTSSGSFRARTTTQSIVNDAGRDRTTIYRGQITSRV
ncbi:Metallo-dependent hydrolase [Glarea lozoyensis ATCC 20868]|uniref:Metallo-dependent hydrolase n=1 Tax=Glarea lozoyensis (strain ATCC 20868 / MF5171) TaxID=1116229 RepID=S3EDB9_GLAL2|nr:Metallo-dependent hydrolase [Glarea lozoyensis ATCC 20868]EPE36278.1 Metallo-dependent hydrolase [Glarea lozoyensis ATCC 20868]